MADLDDRLGQLEQRVRALEDELALHRLMVRYGPSVDSGSAQATAALHTPQCVYDSDGGAPMIGARGIAAMVEGPGHQALLRPGCAHTIGPGVVSIDGDRASAIGYSRVYVREGDAFRLYRVSANHWEFERRDGRWQVSHRTNRLIGTPGGREILKRATE